MSTYTSYQSDPENSFLCTLSTCSIEYGMLTYRPTLVGNGIYLGIFGLLMIVHAFLGIRYKTWTFLVGTTCTCLLEIIGYVGRIELNANPFPLSTFLQYFIPLALGPAFLTGGIYILFGRYIMATSRSTSYIAPRTYTCTFVTADLLTLSLQAVGGALTSTADSDAGRTQGTDILIAGLALQVAAMAIFLGIWSNFSWRLHREVPLEQRNPTFAYRRDWRWSGYPYAIYAAMILIFIRCIYRAVELAQGFSGSLANNQTIFMVLEGPMVICALIIVAVWHPGPVFQGHWQETAWKWNGRDEVVPAREVKRAEGSGSESEV